MADEIDAEIGNEKHSFQAGTAARCFWVGVFGPPPSHTREASVGYVGLVRLAEVGILTRRMFNRSLFFAKERGLVAMK